MEATEPTIERLLKPSEVAHILQVSKAQAYRMISNGEIPSVHFSGKTVRVKRCDLQAFIETSRGVAA